MNVKVCRLFFLQGVHTDAKIWNEFAKITNKSWLAERRTVSTKSRLVVMEITGCSTASY
jgi:hypothetical protein